MVQLITDMPPGTLGFRVSGRLTRTDYAEALVPPRSGPHRRPAPHVRSATTHPRSRPPIVRISGYRCMPDVRLSPSAAVCRFHRASTADALGVAKPTAF
jgi:hypothetical protein